jgi:hypothetical protein
MNEFTDEQLIKHYIALRRKKAEIEDGHKKELEPYVDAMKTIENVIGSRLHERGTSVTSCPTGTGYLSRIMTLKVTDEIALRDFALEHDPSLISVKPVKGAVAAHMELHKDVVIPGIEIDHIVNVNVRSK